MIGKDAVSDIYSINTFFLNIFGISLFIFLLPYKRSFVITIVKILIIAGWHFFMSCAFG